MTPPAGVPIHQSPRQVPYEAYGTRREPSDELADDVMIAIRYGAAATPGTRGFDPW